MNSKSEKNGKIINQKLDLTQTDLINEKGYLNKKTIQKIEEICDENLNTLTKIHAILLNCSNLSKNQKLEFCESERYFMKLYLKKLKDNNNNI